MAKIKRSQFRSFLNTGSIGTPTWSLVGDGVTTGAIEYNPKTSEETYIHEDSATISVESYAPTMPLESTAVAGDAVFEYIDTLRKSRAVLSLAEAEVVNVWLYKAAIGGFYPAERQGVSLQVDEFGGDGGAAAKLNYTVNFVGEPTLGRYNPTLGSFSELNAPAANTLTSLTLGSGTLAPLFAADKSNLFYTTSIAAATVTIASVLSGATIVQKCNGVAVNQGAAGSLVLGENTISIEVTVGAVTVIYYIKATRTV
ncbi:MAG TPA: hypothetical protein PK883_00430 [Anaerolineaceae bacterium]|nr:hypothetical protein [Anaerolineaceae bacterium]